MMNLSRPAAAVLLPAALALTGCATDAAPNPTAVVSRAPGDEAPANDLKNEQVADIKGMDVVTDRQIRLHFTTGDAACYGARPAVKESDHEVLYAVVTGMKPNAPSICTQIGRETTLLVTLDKPIGQRELKKWDEPALH